MSFEVETSPDADMVDLTICTVYTPNLEPYLRLNWELISTLNRRNNWRWLIVDNSEEPEKLFQLGDDRCGTIAGVPKDMAIAEAQRKSYHHAAAFQKSLKHINTRFVLFLDPDFFLLQNEILSDALSYMTDNDLGFLGVPYHPKWYSKIRYFPTVFCMFIDLSTVPIESLNFTPSLKFSKGKKRKKVKNSGPTVRRPLPVRAWDYLLNRTTRRISRWTKLTIQRRSIGGSKDTGYPIYSHYRSHKKIANECMVPVYDPELEFTGAKLALSPANRFIERFLPDRLCYLPKDPNYFTKLGFHEQGYPDVQSKTWEEYLWHGKPFGFHLRQTRQDQLELAKHHRFLTATLDHFINLELAAT